MKIRRTKIIELAAAVSTLLLAGCATQALMEPLPGPATADAAMDSVPGQLLVKTKSRVSDKRAREAFTQIGCHVIDYFENPGVYHIALPDDISMSDGLDAIYELGIAEYAEPNVRWRTNPDIH